MTRPGPTLPPGYEGPLGRLLFQGTNDHYEDAVLYDFEYADQRDDVGWYRDRADELAARGSILELGAGTGRITIPLLRDGHRVVGLDRKRSMLDRLEEKLTPADRRRLQLLEGDLCALPVDDGSQRVVFAPFNVLMHLYTWQRLRTCFEEVARALQPGGWFCFDVLLPDLEWLTLDPREHHCRTRFKHPGTGEPMVYSTNHDYDHATQIAHIRIHYHRAVGRGARIQPGVPPLQTIHLAHRQIWPEELRCLLALAGLELESIGGDFKGHRLTGDAESQVVVARKPGGRLRRKSATTRR